jgi:hypothetical protein
VSKRVVFTDETGAELEQARLDSLPSGVGLRTSPDESLDVLPELEPTKWIQPSSMYREIALVRLVDGYVLASEEWVPRGEVVRAACALLDRLDEGEFNSYLLP